MASLLKKRHIIVIGAGPQGLATGIELLKAGYNVTLVESKDQLGQGVSYRPEHSQWGIAHSGAYYPGETERARLSFAMAKLLNNPTTDDPVLQTYFANSDPIGKLIVARNDEGLKNLEVFAERLTKGGAHFSVIKDKEALRALNEPSLGNLDNVKAVIELPDVRVIHINNYIAGLRSTFEAMGGALCLSHELVEFAVPTDSGRNSTAIVCKTPEGDVTLNGDAVINMAGLYAAPVADKAAQALKKSKDQGYGAEQSPPQTPEALYCKYGVLVRKKTAAPREKTNHVVYVADNAVLDGAKSTVGAHSFVSGQKGADGWDFTIGPFVHHGMRKEGIEDKTLPADCVMSEKMWNAAEGVVPGIKEHREEYNYELIGRIANYVRENGDRDFFKTHCVDDKTGFRVLNCYTSDSPGLTCSPIIAKETAKDIIALLEKTQDRRVGAHVL